MDKKVTQRSTYKAFKMKIVEERHPAVPLLTANLCSYRYML